MVRLAFLVVVTVNSQPEFASTILPAVLEVVVDLQLASRVCVHTSGIATRKHNPKRLTAFDNLADLGDVFGSRLGAFFVELNGNEEWELLA